MSTDRRDFLKLFGVGSLVVPIVGGLPIAAAESKLLAPPLVTLADESSLFHDVKHVEGIGDGKYGITVIMENVNGKRVILQGESFITNISRVAESWMGHKMMYHKGMKMTWEVKGQFVNDIAMTMTEFF